MRDSRNERSTHAAGVIIVESGMVSTVRSGRVGLKWKNHVDMCGDVFAQRHAADAVTPEVGVAHPHPGLVVGEMFHQVATFMWPG